MPIEFHRLIERLALRLQQPLPGATAHEPLRAVAIGDLRPTFEHRTPPKPGSVIILLYADDGKIKFPLTKRPDYVGTHGGQVSFPGGKSEPGETIEQTAVREAEEEIGIQRSDIELIGRLSEFFVIPSNFIVTPVVAWQRTKPVFVPDPVEVVKVLECSLEELLKKDAIHVKDIIAARKYQLTAPHFVFEDEIVWGATAMMLNEFRTVLQEVL